MPRAIAVKVFRSGVGFKYQAYEKKNTKLPLYWSLVFFFTLSNLYRNIKYSKRHKIVFFLVIYNFYEGFRFKAGSAHQSAVNVRHCKKLMSVFRLYASAVLD